VKSWELGRYTMKSTSIISQGLLGTGSGCSFPYGLCLLNLFLPSFTCEYLVLNINFHIGPPIITLEFFEGFIDTLVTICGSILERYEDISL